MTWIFLVTPGWRRWEWSFPRQGTCLWGPSGKRHLGDQLGAMSVSCMLFKGLRAWSFSLLWSLFCFLPSLSIRCTIHCDIRMSSISACEKVKGFCMAMKAAMMMMGNESSVQAHQNSAIVGVVLVWQECVRGRAGFDTPV